MLPFSRTKSDSLAPPATGTAGKKRRTQRKKSPSEEIEEYSAVEGKDADPIDISSNEEESPPRKGKGKAPLKQSNVDIDLYAKNPRKWSAHYTEVREKMGGLRPSTHTSCFMLLLF